MSSFVDALPFFNRRTSPMEEAEGVGRDGLHVNHAAVARISLGQLLKRVGDANAADQHVLEIDQIVGANAPEFGRSIPFVLSFSDLTYSVKTRKKFSLRRKDGDSVSGRKVLLDSISGEAREGEIMAVIGASGSGKSTLIDALANRIAKESLKGSVTLNGELLESNLLKMISAYVMQEDLLYPMLTVEETLMFAAEFRLPRSLSKSKKKTRVEALIDQLGLRRAAGTIIGDDGHRGVSGGERRRVSIGIDIIHDPIILFLDEPTSGLDSTSAFMVVKVLRRIAQSGSIVITSIHQPSSRIIGLLDRLLFLSRGQTVYSGSPAALPQFFAEFGRPIPENENRTEFALDLIRELDSDEASGGTNPLVEFHRSWTSSTNSPVFSAAKQSNTASISRGKFDRPIPENENRTEFPLDLIHEASGGTKPLAEFHRSTNSPVFAAAKQSNTAVTLKDAISASISRGKLGSATVSRFANPFWTEMMVLTRRAGTNSRRLPELFLMRLGAVLVTGFILATIFWRLDSSPKGVQERLGFFAIAMSTMFYTCADALPVFLQERYIFMRETAYNAYRRSSYVLSNTLVGFPALILLSGAFAGTTFFAVGLAGGTQGFIFFFLIVLASFWAGSGFVTFLSGIVSHVMLGYTIVVAILAYFLLFSGFFITGDRIPGYWIWFHYLSLVKYPYEAVLQNEFGDPRKCFVRGVQMFDNTPFSVLPAEAKLKVLQGISGSLGLSLTSETCITTGTGILKQQAVTDLSKWSCLAVTVAWGFFFRVLFYFTLLVGSKNKRR